MTELVIVKMISIFMSFGFIFLAWASKRIVGIWINPSSIFSLFWALYTLIPLILLFPVPINLASILYILMFNFLFTSSVFLFNWKLAIRLNHNKPYSSTVFNTKNFHLLFYLFVFGSIVSNITGVIAQSGLNILDFFTNPIIFAGDYAGKAYGGGLVKSVWAQIGLTVGYLSVIFGGLMYGANGKFRVLILSFTPALLTILSQSQKGFLFISIFIFLAGVLVAKLYDKEYYLISKKGAKKLLFYFFALLPVVAVSFVSRGLQHETNVDLILERIIRYSISYSSGHLYAFSDWFSERYFDSGTFSYQQDSLTLGFYSFMSIFKLLGSDREVASGVFSEYYFYDYHHLETNIYTIFRGFITDFTLIGSLILAIIIGYTCNFFFYRLLCSKKNSFYIVFFIFFVAFSYQSFVVSSFTWLIVPFVMLLSMILLQLHFFLNKNNNTP